MTNHSGSGTASRQQPRPDVIEKARRCRSPVVFWAGLGVLFLVVEIWVLARWVVAGGLHPEAPRGELSPARAAVLRGLQIGIVLGLVATAWYAVRTSRRQGRVSAFAALFAGGITAFWLDPLYNFQQHVRVLPAQALSSGTPPASGRTGDGCAWRWRAPSRGRFSTSWSKWHFCEPVPTPGGSRPTPRSSLAAGMRSRCSTTSSGELSSACRRR